MIYHISQHTSTYLYHDIFMGCRFSKIYSIFRFSGIFPQHLRRCDVHARFSRQVTGKDYFNKGFASDHLTMIQAGGSCALCSLDRKGTGQVLVCPGSRCHGCCVMVSELLSGDHFHLDWHLAHVTIPTYDTYVHAYVIIFYPYLTWPSLLFLVDNASETNTASVIEDPTQ